MLDSAMEALLETPVLSAKSDTHITVFPDRAHFEAALRSMLAQTHGECAMLHIAVLCNRTGKISVCRRMLNLVGSTLRACMRTGEVAYLGQGEFAVLLRGVDSRETANYARTVNNIVAGFRVMWEGEMLSAEARIGGVMFKDGETNTDLLSIAEQAGYMAAAKFGCKVHLLQEAQAAPERRRGYAA
jgi:GGDEF domain-containing protein